MPYVITTYTGPLLDPAGANQEWDSRRAVATLEEARSDARAIALDHGSIGGAQTAMRLHGAGGTIGPLPDGTVITVVRVCDTWCIGVAEDRGHRFPDPENVTVQEGIDAYNAREGS